jgi:transposase
MSGWVRGTAATFGRARRTDRVIELVKLFAYTAGGRPAERLMAKLGIPVSNDTLLRHLKRHQGRRPVAPIPARVVGVDDWSWVKGESYGTIFVDLERREVLDVLSRRSADDTARWFAERPEVEFISRDRCGVYARGARRGAPTARQVADRFHLLQNLRERIEQQLARSRPSVTTIEASHADSEIRVNGPRAGERGPRSACQARPQEQTAGKVRPGQGAAN